MIKLSMLYYAVLKTKHTRAALCTWMHTITARGRPPGEGQALSWALHSLAQHTGFSKM